MKSLGGLAEYVLGLVLLLFGQVTGQPLNWGPGLGLDTWGDKKYDVTGHQGLSIPF